MKSGTLYETLVSTPSEDEIEEGSSISTAKFSELSKSGKVINAYNALLMADRISKKNR